MLVETTKGSANIPEGKIKLTKEEALDYQKNLIDNWPSFWEVFFLRNGRYIATATTFFSSAACVNVFHPIFKFTRGTITGVIPGVLLPPAFIFYKTETILTNDILVMKMDCPLCHHLKFTAFQLYGGILFPSALGMLNAYDGHNIPLKNGEIADYWKKTIKIGSDKIGTFKKVLLAQVITAFFVPYLQNSEIIKISKKIKENPEILVSLKLSLPEINT